MTLRIGIIGAGYIAKLHAERLIRKRDVDVVAVADPSADRAAELARTLDAAAFPTAEELLQTRRPDALFICVPPFAHGAPEAAALEREIPFFVEKPIGLDSELAESIAAEVDRRGLVTSVGYHWRHIDLVREAAELLQEREVRLVQGHWLSSTPGAAWWVRRDRSGGQILEQTTHIFDLIRHLVGEVATVEGSGCTTPRDSFPDSDIADVSVATLRFDSGAVGVVSSTCLLDTARRVGLHLIAERLSIELVAKGPGGGPPYEMAIDTKNGMETRQGRNDPFDAEQHDFLAAVRGESHSTLVPYEEACRSHRLALAAAKACDEGRRVSLSDVHV